MSTDIEDTTELMLIQTARRMQEADAAKMEQVPQFWREETWDAYRERATGFLAQEAPNMGEVYLVVTSLLEKLFVTTEQRRLALSLSKSQVAREIGMPSAQYIRYCAEVDAPQPTMPVVLRVLRWVADTYHR